MPLWLKNLAVSAFGTADKAVLLTGVLVVPPQRVQPSVWLRCDDPVSGYGCLPAWVRSESSSCSLAPQQPSLTPSRWASARASGWHFWPVPSGTLTGRSPEGSRDGLFSAGHSESGSVCSGRGRGRRV